MKKILFLIPTLGGGGAERVLVNLVNNLDKSKYEITVKTLFRNDVNSIYLNKNVNYIKGRIKQFRGCTYFLKLFSPKFLYRFFVKKRYDYVVSFLEGPTARIVSGCPYMGTKKINWIHTVHVNNKVFAHSFRSMIEAQNCYKSFNMTVCVSETVKQNFLSMSQTDKDCIVLYNVNETDKILLRANESVDIDLSNEINIISVGRLTYIKGFDRLISVHKRLLGDGIQHHIYILGSGEEQKKLIKTVKMLNLENTFHFLGFHDNPYKYVKKADLFVCSSRQEGFSTAVTESLIVGTPVVSTCCSGAYELLGYNNEYGIVTENSEEGIYEGLKRMLGDENLRKNYAKQAAIRGQMFSTKNTVDAVQEMFECL